MITSLFALIQAVLQVMNLWDSFLDYINKADLAAAQERRQVRERAADELKRAADEGAFDEASDRLHDNSPRP